MKRIYSQFFPLISILLLFSIHSSGQSWSGVLAPSRAIDWSHAGLPGTFPDGEKTPNPWTPPTRTQCVTSQCNTVSGGNVTASTINAAISSAPGGTYVLIPAGTFALSGTIKITSNNVTLRGSGAATTKLTGGSIQVGDRTWGAASFLTANPAKGATSVTVASVPPSAGRLVALEECDDGFSSTNASGVTHYSGSGYANPCVGSYRDPLGPWVCSLDSSCDNNGGATPNHHFQMHVLWVPAGGISGNTVSFSSPIWNDSWKTSRSAALVWLNNSGTVGVGLEGFTLQGTTDFDGTYACWIKGVRFVSTSSAVTLLSFQFDAHSLVANSYIVETASSSANYLVQWGYDGGEAGQSDHLFINNILEGGLMAGFGNEVGIVVAFNYIQNGGSPTFMAASTFEHHGGTSFILKEGNQLGRLLDDNTWATHNFNTFFRNYGNCTDPEFPNSSPYAIGIDGWARFENMIGNAWGGGSGCGSSYSTIVRINENKPDPTGLTQGSLMSWGNFTACSGDSRCNTTGSAIFASSGVPSNLASFGANSTPYQNPVPSSATLPASFFMNSMTAHPSGGTGLSWWKACASWSSFPTSCAINQHAANASDWAGCNRRPKPKWARL